MVAVDICNLALSYLGDSATVASIDPPEGSAQAQHCARFYPMALGLLLDAHEWNFITMRAALAVVQNDYNGWRFAYAMPSDALDVISVKAKCLYPVDYFEVAILNYLGESWPLHFEQKRRGDFQIETLNGAEVILSNAEEAIALYTVSTVQPGMFPPLFTDALAWKLASMLAGPLLKGDAGATESKRCLSMHQAILEQAKGQDSNQRKGNPQPPAPWIAARA